MTSDLSKFYRIPKININLPSNGNYYPTDFIQYSMDGSLPIKQMTARDEMILQTPDSLLNGDSILHIIESCTTPYIKDVKKLLAPDVEAILLGIFYASFGPNFDFQIKCAKCEHENNFETPIRNVLDKQTTIEYPAVIEKKLDPDTTIEVLVQPYTFETNTKHQLTLFEQSKMMSVLKNSESDDEQVLKSINESIRKMIDIKFKNTVDCIMTIKLKNLVNNEWNTSEITDKKEIEDFVFNADKDIMDPIIEKIDELNKSGINNNFHAVCQNEKCKHEWDTRIEFNPSSFFVQSSKHRTHLK